MIKIILLLLLSLFFISHAASSQISTRIIGGTPSVDNAWSFMTALMNRHVGVTVNGSSFIAPPILGTPDQHFSGSLGYCGMALETCLDVSGKVCLIERGGVLSSGEFSTFTDKLTNCKAGGGIAAIVYNNADSLLSWFAESSLPAVAVSQTDGNLLLNHIGYQVQTRLIDIAPTTSFCGGTYIGNKLVLTAAHCVEDISIEKLVLNIGGIDLETDQKNIHYVEEIIIHPDYNPLTVQNDIAYIKLKMEPQDITPILLANETIVNLAMKDGTEVTALGRGAKNNLKENEPATEAFDPKLYEVNLTLVTNTQCNEKMEGLIDDSMICAGSSSDGFGTCFGDSGGPLLSQHLGEYYLIGITSWGLKDSCGLKDSYDVFTRVPLYKDELKYTLSPNTQGGSFDKISLMLLIISTLIFRITRKYILGLFDRKTT